MAPPAPPTSSRAKHDDGEASSHQPLEPPTKRVRREYPWRPEFERDFGVRPIQVDATTGDAVLVECRFCLSFGREPPVAPAAPTVSKTGQLIKSRARTRNVAHWKYPFRTDNMRSHHLQQHAHKWTEYRMLLEQCKHPSSEDLSAAVGDTRDEHEVQRVSAVHRLNTFFGEPHEAAVGTTPTTTPANGVAGVARLTNGGAASAPPALTATATTMLPIITRTALVDAVLPAMVDIPTSAADILGPDTPTAAPLLVPVKAASSDASVTSYTIASGPATDLRGVLRLLAAGLSFSRVAEIAPSLQLGETATLTRSHVAAYARALVASGLERIAQLLAAAWTYSIRLTVYTPSSDRAPTPLRVSVYVPVDQGRRVEMFHVATLALWQTSESKKSVASFLCVLLSALDKDWQQKVLSVGVDGATHCLGVHADMKERIVRPLLVEPQVTVLDGRQNVDHAVQTAWALFRRQTDESVLFTGTLMQLVANVRGIKAIVQSPSPDQCPFVQLDDARSVMRTLKWLLSHRDMLAENDVDAPVWWWLLGHVCVDVWTDCLVTTEAKVVDSRAGDGEAVRAIVDQVVQSLIDQCGMTTSKSHEKARRAGDRDAEVVEFDETTRVAALRVGSGSTTSRLTWSTKDIAQWLRALNVSTRRMFEKVGKDSSSLRTTERQTARFVLLLLGQLQQSIATPISVHKTTSSAAARAPATSALPPPTAPPPTLPLDFVAIDASDIVDFVETHSRRLERAYPTMFLDLVSREIRDLQTYFSTNESLRTELERVSQSQQTSAVEEELLEFSSAWALVPHYPAVRTLAAGLRTAIPGSATAVDNQLVAFSRAENDETPHQALADLAVEASAHACQLERLQRAFTAIPTTDSELVV